MYVYPAMKKHLPNGEEAVNHDLEEHRQLEETLKELEGVDGSDPRFSELLRTLDAVLQDHITDEETKHFPQLRSALPPAELVELATTGLTVRVSEGTASVDVRGERIAVSAGEVVTVPASGEVVRSALPPGDRSLDWAADVASPIEIEGVTLGAFLDWAVRERGVALRFEDPSLAEKARGVVLRGSIEGMTFDESIDSVMATTGLRHRWEQDALVVSSP